METTIKNELKQEAINDIIEYLDGYESYYCDLHNYVFNTDYYTTSENEAIEILENYDTFKAIGEIIEYEKFNFGEVYTDVSDPLKVMNMLYYIIGYEIVGNLFDNKFNIWNEEATQENNDMLINELKEMVKNL